MWIRLVLMHVYNRISCDRVAVFSVVRAVAMA
jgi:hypothetical protein